MQIYIYKAWVKFFGKAKFRRLNSFLFNLSIRGLGVLNYKGYQISGEKWFLKTFLKSLIEKHPIIFDVGASVGNYTKLIYEIFPNAKIYAFEPHPITFCKLSQNLKEIPFKLVNCGLGEQVSIKRLYDYADNQGSGHATLHKGVISYLHKGQEVSLDVKIDTLDSFCKAKSISYIDFLKIDTEGNEYSCLYTAP